MKLGKKQTVGENLLYVMVWTIVMLVPVLNSKMLGEVHIGVENVLTAWRKIAPYLLIFLIHNSVVAPRFMLRRKYVLYMAVNLLTITAVFAVVELYERFLPESMLALDGPYITPRKASFTDLAIYWNVLLGLFMTGVNTSIKLIYKSMRDEQVMEALKRQNLQAEMDYLKYQINPHFFMNTLNNIHALIDIDTEYAKQTVIELSKMMRYVLYDSGRESISLEKDIQFIRNYIELMRIRYTDAVDIRLDAPPALPGRVSIPPLLLIVFVENAFKHGVSYNRHSFIHMQVGYAENRVWATIVNSRHPDMPGSEGAGIGLENVRKRLELIYGSDYMLQVDDSLPTVYTVKLEIPVFHA